MKQPVHTIQTQTDSVNLFSHANNHSQEMLDSKPNQTKPISTINIQQRH